MNILITPDVDDWAIGELSRSIMQHNPRFNFSYVPVHPRGISGGIVPLTAAIERGVDFWHAMYWNSALQILQFFPELGKVPSLLTHHNHSNLESKDWRGFTGINEMTSWGCDVLRKKHDRVYKIPHGIDLDRFSYITDRSEAAGVGYVGRVVPWKHLADVCAGAKAVGRKVVGCGYIDKPDYWQSCKPYADDGTLDFRGSIGRQNKASRAYKDELYRKMAVFVMYSTDEKESGTLPLLEAMARGVPVMATSQGMARDLIEDGKNGIIFTPENFVDRLRALLDNPEQQEALRKAAWETIKHNPEQKMAREYAKTYYDLLWDRKPVVSVIVPTHLRADKLADLAVSVEEDPYPAKELIIADDGNDPATKKVVETLKEKLRTPVLYLATDGNGYGLAKARNLAAIEALGSVLLFMDDRFVLQKGLEHISQVKPREWHFGAKETNAGRSTKRSFIENFSWVRKQDFVDGGMFNERMVWYGGLSQLTRRQYQDRVSFIYDDEGVAREALRASGGRKSDIWKAKDLIDKLT